MLRKTRRVMPRRDIGARSIAYIPSMLEDWIRHSLLCVDPEKAHGIAQRLLRWRYRFSSSNVQSQKTMDQPTRVFGLDFSNPIGLAAGWDKNAECIDALFQLGFGFVEVGTVTPKPQIGNPKPRLFRIPEKQALINRMGFNNAGIEVLVENIKKRQSSGIVGVNIGKNKETSLDLAADDYLICMESVYPYAHYIVVNISSPNTPGLRELQSEYYLHDLLNILNQKRKELSIQQGIRRPLLVKTTVDMPILSYTRFMKDIIDNEIDGLIISNTTIDHSLVSHCQHGSEMGGLSGAPLREKTSEMIRVISDLSEKKLPIIGTGGIVSGNDALLHMHAGASLLQLFTGFVYRGSRLIRECIQHLSSEGV